MNKAEIETLVNDAFDNTPTAMSTPIRETVEYLDGRGLLGARVAQVEVNDIKTGDWIAYFIDGDPGELYQAGYDRDDNLNFTGAGAEFFRVDRSLFGKSKPEPKVEDIEPGTRFRASLLGKPVTEYVRGKGADVFQVADTGKSIRWAAINKDFTSIEIIE